jgi:hypothetical protein
MKQTKKVNAPNAAKELKEVIKLFKLIASNKNVPAYMGLIMLVEELAKKQAKKATLCGFTVYSKTMAALPVPGTEAGS